MNETWPNAGALTGTVEQTLADLRAQLEALSLRSTIDPDGDLAALWSMLRLKRGSRRG